MNTTSFVLAVPFADVSAAHLRLSIGGLVPATLAHLTIAQHPQPRFSAGVPPLTLGILGSSHVAFIGESAAPVHVEELSCTAIGGVPIHDIASAPESPSIDMEVLGAEGFGNVVGHMHELCDDPAALVAEFPGEFGAITAVRGIALPDGYRWWTWHLYPDGRGGGEVVATRSEWKAAR